MGVRGRAGSPSTDKVAVLASGGVDSNVLLAEELRRGREVYPCYVRCGFRWETAEIHWLKKYLKALSRLFGKNLKPLTILHQPVDDVLKRFWGVTGKKAPGYSSRDETVYLPGRNLLLLSKIAVFCSANGIPRISLGSLRGNPFPDASRRFFSLMERTASTALKTRLRIEAPFAGLKKKDVAERGRGLPLHFSFSCLNPRGMRRCGCCNKCAEKDKVLYGP